jgi:hypothetical protein
MSISNSVFKKFNKFNLNIIYNINNMTIKYGELTIIKDIEQSTLSNLLYWITNEEHKVKKSKYIFLFDDGEICDAEDKLLGNFNFSFLNDINLDLIPFSFTNSFMSKLPLSFEIKSKKSENRRIYFLKGMDTEKTLGSLLDFNQLFKSYSKYMSDMKILSVYNCIYYCHKFLLNSKTNQPEIFGLIRIKSTEQMPRFQFAYDSDEFTKEEIIYLIHHIFNS